MGNWPRGGATIRAAGAHPVYLPPYSPDLNPIEAVFGKIKEHLRSLALRTQDVLWNSMQSVLDTVTSSDAVNSFRHCGYTFMFTIMCIACLVNNVYFDGLSVVDAVMTLAVNDMRSLWWTLVSIPIWLTARGLHGLLEYGRFTFRSWPKM